MSASVALKLRMAVALYDLAGYRIGAQTKLRADIFLDAWRNCRVRADCAGNLAYRDVFYRSIEPSVGAAQFIYPDRQFKAESCRLGVDAVRAPDHEHVAVLPRRRNHCFREIIQRRSQQIASLDQAHGERGIHYVR